VSDPKEAQYDDDDAGGEPMTALEFPALRDQEHRWAELVGGEIVVDRPSPLPAGLALQFDAVLAE
jgi:hypothetical protein